MTFLIGHFLFAADEEEENSEYSTAQERGKTPSSKKDSAPVMRIFRNESIFVRIPLQGKLTDNLDIYNIVQVPKITMLGKLVLRIKSKGYLSAGFVYLTLAVLDGMSDASTVDRTADVV